MKWWESVKQALENLGGKANLKDIYDEVRRVRVMHGDTTPPSLEEVVRKELEYNSSDSSNWRGTRDQFFSVLGIGNGMWGLRDHIAETPLASDINELQKGSESQSKEQTIYRIIRDTVMTRKIKALHDFECQICGATITLPDGKSYAEAHHIIPIGSPHNGPDIPSNIIVVCPNHHAMLDFGCVMLDINALCGSSSHTIAAASVRYHNSVIFSASAQKPLRAKDG
ncbi:MAG: HNH endonuclease [Alphaproteobacteria bacterium]|nr:HNH endonuclease [Alphaproteobacteria bacterium]